MLEIVVTSCDDFFQHLQWRSHPIGHWLTQLPRHQYLSHFICLSSLRFSGFISVLQFKKPKWSHAYYFYFGNLLQYTNCSLNVAQRFHQAFPYSVSRARPILSKQSAIGLVLATGNVGATISTTGVYSVYRSSDGGLLWKEVSGEHGNMIGSFVIHS